ncbi:hypothetical protein M2146_002542 [Lachnospiraceae bacterium PF1-22]
MTKNQRIIVNTYNDIEERDPDISTERLLTMVEYETGADASEIVEALMANEEDKKKETQQRMAKKPRCYVPEKNNPYPLCVGKKGRKQSYCKSCNLWKYLQP